MSHPSHTLVLQNPKHACTQDEGITRQHLDDASMSRFIDMTVEDLSGWANQTETFGFGRRNRMERLTSEDGCLTLHHLHDAQRNGTDNYLPMAFVVLEAMENDQKLTLGLGAKITDAGSVMATAGKIATLLAQFQHTFTEEAARQLYKFVCDDIVKSVLQVTQEDLGHIPVVCRIRNGTDIPVETVVTDIFSYFLEGSGQHHATPSAKPSALASHKTARPGQDDTLDKLAGDVVAEFKGPKGPGALDEKGLRRLVLLCKRTLSRAGY